MIYWSDGVLEYWRNVMGNAGLAISNFPLEKGVWGLLVDK